VREAVIEIDDALIHLSPPGVIPSTGRCRNIDAADFRRDSRHGVVANAFVCLSGTWRA
jgi:hypothetical protein